MRALLLAGALLLLLSSGVAADSVESGPLRAETADDPWSLGFSGSGVTLAEHAGERLGFRTATGRHAATRVISKRSEGAALVVELTTDDPLGRRIEARIAPAGEGILSLDARVLGGPGGVEATGIGFEAQERERFLGFGERSNAVDQRGNEVESYVTEGPFQTEERPFISPGFVPPWGFHGRDDAAYFPMPWLLSSRGYGVLVDNPETSVHRLASEAADRWSVEVESERLRLRVFAGPRPADVLRRLTATLGRQPPAAAPFYFGPWFQPNGDLDTRREQLKTLQDADAPVSLAQTYTHYLPCGDHVGGSQREQVDFFHSRGLAITTYFNPMICVDYRPVYDDAAAQGALTVNSAGEPYVYRYNEFVVSQFDFNAEAGRRFYQRLLGEAVADGYDGWMEDFGEYTPPDSVFADGAEGAQMHNYYPVPYHCTAHEFALAQERPLARFIRSGWTGVQPCAQIVWNGDPTTDWGFDGLRSAVQNGLTMGLSGISTWGSDVGGFFALGARRLSTELLIRWVQMGALSPVMRTQANGIAIPSKARPQVWEPEVLPHWRRWAKLHTQLYPYLVAADAEYRRSGLPIMRHLALAYPDDPEAGGREDQYLFGPDLLAAPVVEQGATARRVYLPAGRWVDLWRTLAYRERDGGLTMGSAQVLDGAREVELPAPLEEAPLLARAGAVIPLLPPDVDTLSSYGDSDDVVKLSDRRKRLVLLAFPSGTTRARFGRRGRIISREGAHTWRLRVRGPRRRFRLQASLATLADSFEPCAVKLRGKRLRFRYDRDTHVLRTRFKARRATLTVRGRCR